MAKGDKRFQKAFMKFIQAGRELSEVWKHDMIAYYPNYLPSFDEFVEDFRYVIKEEV